MVQKYIYELKLWNKINNMIIKNCFPNRYREFSNKLKIIDDLLYRLELYNYPSITGRINQTIQNIFKSIQDNYNGLFEEFIDFLD